MKSLKSIITNVFKELTDFITFLKANEKLTQELLEILASVSSREYQCVGPNVVWKMTLRKHSALLKLPSRAITSRILLDL